jgi:hypothetical protein
MTVCAIINYMFWGGGGGLCCGMPVIKVHFGITKNLKYIICK